MNQQASGLGEASWQRGLLRTRGFFVAEALIGAPEVARLASEVSVALELGPSFVDRDGTRRAVALLEHSDTALQLLDHDPFWDAVTGLFESELVLSRADGVFVSRKADWRIDFEHVKRAVAGRQFRPGLTLFAPVGADANVEVEVMRASHLLPADAGGKPPALEPLSVTVPAGAVLVLEAGTWYRAAAVNSFFLSFALVRPWLKPDIWLSSALDPQRLNRLGRRGRTLCGADVGLPTSVEQFLAIEEASLGPSMGRQKGSGI